MRAGVFPGGPDTAQGGPAARAPATRGRAARGADWALDRCVCTCRCATCMLGGRAGLCTHRKQKSFVRRLLLRRCLHCPEHAAAAGRGGVGWRGPGCQSGGAVPFPCRQPQLPAPGADPQPDRVVPAARAPGRGAATPAQACGQVRAPLPTTLPLGWLLALSGQEAGCPEQSIEPWSREPSTQPCTCCCALPCHPPPQVAAAASCA